MSDTLLYLKGKSLSHSPAYDVTHVFQDWKTKEGVYSVLCSSQISRHIYFPDFISSIEKKDFFMLDEEVRETAYEKALAALENMQEPKCL